ncbi:response regulator transcription factor [Pricia sp. S334]|uniref:Response regulator transcription factor n=1 Tax=Pricia mediterranea TaxID=3076079 RepID=A0ABU3L9N8_9FLAO|nr:response regulator transcription factor [Pricia sp. S334]MDT7830456.1 response regulator transcription factor [Pricia sp. S334]
MRHLTGNLPGKIVSSACLEPRWFYIPNLIGTVLTLKGLMDATTKSTTMSINTLNCIVIDNDQSFHTKYRSYFDSFTEYSLADVYTSAEEALAEYDTHNPDIVFIEVALNDGCGIDYIQHFRKKDAQVKVIMLGAQNDFDLVKKAFKHSANGYISKPVNARKLYNALDSIKNEGATMSNDIISLFVATFQRKSREIFSERENQVVDLLCQGATYKSIAEKLFVTASAVNFHVQNIYLKLDVNSKSEALQKLQQLDYVGKAA